MLIKLSSWPEYDDVEVEKANFEEDQAVHFNFIKDCAIVAKMEIGMARLEA